MKSAKMDQGASTEPLGDHVEKEEPMQGLRRRAKPEGALTSTTTCQRFTAVKPVGVIKLSNQQSTSLFKKAVLNVKSWLVPQKVQHKSTR